MLESERGRNPRGLGQFTSRRHPSTRFRVAESVAPMVDGQQRAPTVTPDRQRELFLFLLGAALGAVLLQAGWRVASDFGDELSLVKETLKRLRSG